MSSRPIYLDSNATTPVDPRVLETMMPYFSEYFGNPSSINHLYGWEAEAAVKKARQIIAQSINSNPSEIIFTSGATEANNLALKGVVEAYFSKGKHLITVATEHRAILDPCRYLESLGFTVTVLPVDSQGLVDLEQLKAALRPETIIVSIMAANNEIGVLQPLPEIGKICRAHGVLFHTDAAQAIGKISLDVEAMNIDLMSLTAHKIYGPKGIGALYVRRKNPRVTLMPQMQGGGQEKGIRPGTLYTPQIVGFAKAIEIALAELRSETERLERLRNQLWQGLNSQIEGIHLNGHPQKRLANNLNISIEGIDGAALLLGLQSKIALSSGSACTSTKTEPSHVLKALGHSDALAYASLRFGLGRFNSAEEIEQTQTIVGETVRSLRQAKVKV